MSGKVQRLRLRLFVEGVELPVISCQVQAQPNSPTMASIQIPPLAEATRFLPRSLVHVFFLDLYSEVNPEYPNPTRDTAAKRAVGPSTYEQDKDRADGLIGSGDPAMEVYANDLLNTDAALSNYKLLFVGDLMGFNWTKNATNRSLVLQCADPSNYWDYAQQFNNQDLFGPGLKAMFSGGSTNLFTDFLEEPGGAIVRILMTPSQRYPGLEGLLGGIIHLLEAMGGSYYYDKKFAGQNIFFSISELRLRITQMVTAYTKDKTSKKLLGGGYDSLFGRSIGNLGSQASFRKIINMLSGVIFHETYGQPCPLYAPGTNGTISGFKRKKIVNILKSDGTYPFAEPVEAARSMLASVQLIRTTLAATLTSYGGAPNAKAKAKLAKDGLDNVAIFLTAIRDICSKNSRHCLKQAPVATSKGKSDIAKVAKECSQLFTRAGRAAANAIGQAKLKGPLESRTSSTSLLSKHLSDIEAALSQIPELEANVTAAKEAVPAILAQQIIRPDVWFSAPPRCNVLFPENYSSLNYSRQFMQEPTRLLLKTHDEFFGEDELFDNFYFAPKAITLKQEANTLQSMLRGDILDHELFTGILPVFEKMGEFNIFAARSGMVNGKTPKVGLAQRSTNFLYFKYRFAARQLQISGKFNPYIAVGFPGLVIDKYVDVDTLKLHRELTSKLPNPNGLPSQDMLQLLGTHFLGNFTEVTHQLDQSQGTTLINCSYARQPEESVEFLGNVQTEVTARVKQKGKVALVESNVASLYPPRVGSQGPQFGKITAVKDVTDQYASTDQVLPVYGGSRDKKTKQITTTAVIGRSQMASLYGDQVVELVGGPELVVSFRAYRITEEKSQSKKEVIDLPPEEYIRPGWYGECWHPSNISDVYYDFFNTGAITEATEIENTDVSGTGGELMFTDAEQAISDIRNPDDPKDFTLDTFMKMSLTKQASIQQAVTYLVLTYSVMKQAGFDVDDFIRSYTWRPIATMLDMFGSSDLQLDTDGKSVVKGVEGFHSRAFGPFDNLFGLVTPDIQEIVGIKKGSPQAQKADTRKRKLEAVLRYPAQLRLSRAILG